MNSLNKKSELMKYVFIFGYAILLFSRLSVISGNYNISFDPILLEVIYLTFLTFFALYVNGFKITFKNSNKTFKIICFLLILYVVLFGIVFVNPEMKSYTGGMFKTQSMFLAIVIINAAILIKYKLFDTFLLVSFFVTSVTLMIQFVVNISELNIANLMNALSFSDRTRASFGFGHYNLLGGTCVCNIINWVLLKKRNKLKQSKNFISIFFICLTVIMLLSSASRSAITSLIVFAALYLFINISKWSISKNFIVLIRFFILVGIIIIGILTFTASSFDDLIFKANRFTLFKAALPTFFESGRTGVGLGYAANEVYGMHLTSYVTYWLDNSYIYTLVTTGYIGSSIYAFVIVAIAKRMKKLKHCEIGIIMICIFVLYLYIGLFEITLFTGTTFGYFYLTLFLVYISSYFEE